MKKLLIAAGLSAVLSCPAFATNGTAPVGIGQSAKGSGGAGAAYPQDTLAAGINPAGMVHLGNRMDIGIEIFQPDRRLTWDGNPGVIYDGNNPKRFYIPEFGYNRMLNDKLSFGVAVFGSGGQNATYTRHPFIGPLRTKTDLSQIFIMPTWSYKVDDRNSIGIAPVIAVQTFELINAAFGSFPSPGHETSYGVGMRVGWMGQVTDRITLGGAIQSTINMGNMDNYPQIGSIDVPANITLGAAIKATDKLDILADLYWIDYAGVAPIGTPSSAGGFGWSDIFVLKLGAVYKYSDGLTLRAGVNIGESPLPSGAPNDGFVTSLVPATTKSHVTLGFTKKIKDDFSLTGSFIYTMKEDFTPAAPPGFRLTSTMDQLAIGVSANWEF